MSLKDFVKTLSRVPKLVVLDIDYTIWPLHVDCYVTPPFKSDGKGGATDRYGEKIELFKDVREIFSELDSAGIAVAAASSTCDPSASQELQEVLDVYNNFQYKELYPTRKFKHFKNIMKESGVSYEDMLFFDDDPMSISDILTLGVTCYFIKDRHGLTMSRLKEGFKEFSDKIL